MKHIFTISLCFLALSLSAQVDCPNTFDNNSDGAVTINDLLDLLAVFGDSDTDSDGIWDSVDDCIDLTACNYSNDPTETCNYIDVLGNCGGGCESDGDEDGICDSEDDCVGVLDECGVCNGPGATEVVIESITILYDSLYAEQIDEWLVFEIGADTVFNYTCNPVFNSCGDLVAHEGYNYNTVQIGEQCWFSENCRYLPEVSPSGEYSETEPYYYVYDYQGTDVTAAKATDNYQTYGVLYNWPAVMTAGICPSGWHIPSDGEWQTMEIALGMSESEASETDWRGSPVGDYMKSSSGWNGSNTSGFSGLPGGHTLEYTFESEYYGWWWTSSEYCCPWEFDSDFVSYYRGLAPGNTHVWRGSVFQLYGHSARCVIDYVDECGVFNGDNSTCSDECGVPNGDNSTCLGCDGVPNSDLVYDECEVCGGDNSTCEDECGVPNGDNSTCFTTCGEQQIEHEGYDYSTVQIGEQCWFAENCRYLPVVSSSSAFSETSPYYYVYGYEGSTVSEAKATTNYTTYGVLYNWPAVMTEGICPSGWHIPSDGEWQTMEMSLGMSEAEANDTGVRGTDEGYQMKSTSGWYSNGNGSNSSGFNGLPGGDSYPGGFYGSGSGSEYSGNFWSASESGSASWRRSLNYEGSYVTRNPSTRSVGFSARCLRD